MMSLAQLWAGRMYGTNTGNVFVDLEAKDDRVEGLLRVNDEGVGVFVYAVAGTFADGKLQLEGVPKTPPEDAVLGELKLTGTLSAEGSLRGTWETTIGTGGAFVLHPHGAAIPGRTSSDLPERIHTITRQLGAVRLYSDDFRALVATLQQDFEARPVVTYREGGVQVSRYASEVIDDIGKLGEHRYIQVTVQQPEAYGINRGATVELAEMGNEIRVQGVSQTWVLGKTEALIGALRRHERKLQTMLARHGLSIYMIIFFAGFAFMPELPLYSRLVFLAAAIALLIGAQFVHRRLVPVALVHLSARRASLWERALPSLLSLLIATGATVVGGVVFEIIRRVGPLAGVLPND